MSQKTEKKRRKMIREYIEENKDMVLEEVMVLLLNESFLVRLAYCWSVLFKRGGK